MFQLAFPLTDVSRASFLGQKAWSRVSIRLEGVMKSLSPSLSPLNVLSPVALKSNYGHQLMKNHSGKLRSKKDSGTVIEIWNKTP